MNYFVKYDNLSSAMHLWSQLEKGDIKKYKDTI